MRRTIFVLVAAVLAAPGLSERFHGLVVAVSDGDTIRVAREIGGGKVQLRVRLEGIDSPEMNQPYGGAAKRFTSKAVLRRTVVADDRGKDKYGRTLGWIVYTDAIGRSRELNPELVKAGMAWWYVQYAPRNRTLRDAERAARKAKRGLWADPRPIAPWVWRHGGAVRHAIESGKARPGGKR